MSSGSGTPQAARRRRVNEQITTTPRHENTETKRDGATAIPCSFLAVYVIIAIGVAAQLFVAFFVLELVRLRIFALALQYLQVLAARLA
mmetsp:Transcript_3172/g.9509  ORF Transcript_3172/g.9509 Transcript_3172/m.9509 type:complete len:89 (-) Transcript_3172:990-1256(-)